MIGGDVRVDDIRRKGEIMSGNHVIFPSDTSSVQLSMLNAIVMVTKAGIASDPFLISEGIGAGVFLSFIICIAMLLLTQFSFHIFIKTWVFGEAYSYDEVWRRAFGRYGSWIPIALVILSYITFVIFHAWELYDNLRELIESLWVDHPAILVNQWFLIYVMSALTALPALFVKRIVSFTSIAWISLFCVILGAVCVLVRLFKQIDTIGFDPEKQIVWFSTDFQMIMQCVGNFNTAFFAHPFVSMILKDMKKPTARRCLGVTWWANIISALCHYITALGGYLCFCGAVNDESCFWVMDPYEPEVIIGKICHYIVSACSNAFYTYFLARQVSSFILPETEGRTIPNVVSGVAVIALYAAMNFLDDVVIEIADLIGNVAFIILAFLLPSCFYLAEYGFSKKIWGLCAILLMVIGLPISILILYTSIVGM